MCRHKIPQRRRLAADSLAFNVRNPIFCATFPDLVALHEERTASGSSSSPATGAEGSCNAGKPLASGDIVGDDPLTSLEDTNTVMRIFAVVVALVVLLLAFVLR